MYGEFSVRKGPLNETCGHRGQRERRAFEPGSRARGKRASPRGEEGHFQHALDRDEKLKRYVNQSWQRGTAGDSSRLGEPGKPGLGLALNASVSLDPSFQSR